MAENNSIQAELLGQLLRQSAVGDNVTAQGQQQSAQQDLLAALGAQPPAAVEPERPNMLAMLFSGLGDALLAAQAGFQGRAPSDDTALQRLFDRRQQRAAEQTARQDKQFEQQQRIKELEANINFDNAAEAKRRSYDVLDRQASLSETKRREGREDKRESLRRQQEIDDMETRHQNQLKEIAARRKSETANEEALQGASALRNQMVFGDGTPGTSLRERIANGEPIDREEMLFRYEQELRAERALTDKQIGDELLKFDKILDRYMPPSQPPPPTDSPEVIRNIAAETQSLGRRAPEGPEEPLLNVLARAFGLSGEGFQTPEPGLGIAKEQDPRMRALEATLGLSGNRTLQ